MFTGIVQGMGIVKAVSQARDGFDLKISADWVLGSLALGDSICVDGVCLTVSKIEKNSFSVNIVHESLFRSTLKELRTNSSVNLELAMHAADRFGGHIVTGHVDGVGKIVRWDKRDKSPTLEIACSPLILKYIVQKGSIAINGISLTVMGVANSTFKVAVIPFTIEKTNLAHKGTGDKVNIEADVLAKYVEKQLINKQVSSIDDEFLRKNGFAV